MTLVIGPEHVCDGTSGTECMAPGDICLFSSGPVIAEAGRLASLVPGSAALEAHVWACGYTTALGGARSPEVWWTQDVSSVGAHAASSHLQEAAASRSGDIPGHNEHLHLFCSASPSVSGLVPPCQNGQNTCCLLTHSYYLIARIYAA